MNNKARFAQLCFLFALILSSCQTAKGFEKGASFQTETSNDVASRIALLAETGQCNFQNSEDGDGILVNCANFLLDSSILEKIDRIVIIAGSQRQVIEIQDILDANGFNYSTTRDYTATAETYYVEGWRNPQDSSTQP